MNFMFLLEKQAYRDKQPGAAIIRSKLKLNWEIS